MERNISDSMGEPSQESSNLDADRSQPDDSESFSTVPTDSAEKLSEAENPSTTLRGFNLLAGDLVDDRELADSDQDRLAHGGIVDQLAALSTTVNTPSNIALYGPWGSGKSGIANLLKSKIDGRDGVRLVRFDAFKYADVPLRRNFISAVASELECKQTKFHDDLYSGRTKTDITVPPATLFKLLGVFALLLTGLVVILAIVVTALAFWQSNIIDDTDFGVELRTLSKQVVLAGLVPASMLAALITLASKTFTLDRSLSKPDSDEQFEKIFKELVSAAGAKRLVVFVDELDRCSPSEVVATLDTIRTFLGIDRCVFIVAADQNVLEGALTRAARQETPADDSNPYYSTGSAYLDKVFQYQLSLPPLLTQSVSKYAMSLVEKREGLWAEVKREYVLSVLIPTHVASPRRVKHLLNTFTLTYRLAQERYKAGLLAEDPSENAAAIARLVCLRVEFPLFARHLEVEPNLPTLVLELMRDCRAELPAATSESSVELAKSYALENAAPSNVLVDDSSNADDHDDDRATQIGEAHNKQLLNYLSRTRQVRGPSRDLIYLQSTGTVFGLDGELALAVERAAEDVDITSLRQRVDGLGDAEQEGVLQILTNQIRTGIGLTAINAARSLLLLTEAEPDLPVATVADTVAEAICFFDGDSNDFLDDETVGSAWALGKVGFEASAVALRRCVISTITRAEFETPDFFFEDVTLALADAPLAVAEFLSARVVSEDGPAVVARFFELDDEDLAEVLTSIRSRVAALAIEAATSHAEWTKDQDAEGDATVNRNSPTTPPTTEDSDQEPVNPKSVLDSLANKAATKETPIQHLVLSLLLAVNAQEARTAAHRLIGKTEPISDSDLTASMLRAIRSRTPGEWKSWLSQIVPSAITSTHVEPLSKLVAKLWLDQPQLNITADALEALTPLIDNLPAGRAPDLNPDILLYVEDHVSSTEEASERHEILYRARLFASAGVVDLDQILLTVVNSLQDTLEESLAPVDTDDPLYTYLVEDGSEAVRASAHKLNDQELQGILFEAGRSHWLDQLGQVSVLLELAMAAGPSHVFPANLPTPETMAEITSNYGSSAIRAAELWLQLTNPTPEEFVVMYDPLRRANAYAPEFVEAARQVQQSWTVEQHRALLDEYLAKADLDVPVEAELDVLGLADADENQVAELLIKRYSTTTNNTQRQAIITLWGKARIHDNSIRRRLVENIIYKLLDLKSINGNNGAAELALTALDTVGKPLPSRVKSPLGDRVKAAVTGNNSLENRALAVLSGLGYKTTTNFFGRAKRVDYKG